MSSSTESTTPATSLTPGQIPAPASIPAPTPVNVPFVPVPPNPSANKQPASSPAPPPPFIKNDPKVPDLMASIDMTRNAYPATSSKFIIDVIPDSRNMIKSIIFNVLPKYSEYNLKDTASASPLSILAYLTLSIYAFHLHHDHMIRRPESDYASDFMTKPKNVALYNNLMSMKLPKFMATILNGLNPTSDPRRTNIAFIPTLTGFSFKHDLPRVLPPSLFLMAHNLISTLSARTPPAEIFNHFYGSTFVTFDGTEHKIGQVLGTNLTVGTQVFHFPNWLNKAIHATFNPVVMRNLQSRPFFTDSTFLAPSFTTANFNPYEYLLMADKNNSGDTDSFVSSMNKFFEDHEPTSTTLADIIANLSGSNIMTHSVSIPPLPTWHNEPTAATTSTDIPVNKSRSDFATKIKYLTPSPISKRTENILPQDPKTSTGLFYLVSQLPADAPDANSDFLEFDIDEHDEPQVRYFDPIDTSISKLAYTVITGLKIESFEIDGFTVPLPNCDIPLSTDNSLLLQSALPLSVIQDSMAPYVDILDRKISHINSQPVLVSLYDMSRNYLGRITPTYHGTIPTTLPGFDILDPIGSISRMFNTYGFNIGTKPPIGELKHHAWSSYRYVRSNQGDITDRVFMILSFRPIYGTNITLSESKFPPTLIIL
jgi:hypothetical protein